MSVCLLVPQGQGGRAAETGPAGSQGVGAPGKAQAAGDHQQDRLCGNGPKAYTHKLNDTQHFNI